MKKARSKSNDLQESFFFVNAPRGGAPVQPPFEPKELFRLSAQGIYIGTSSWKYRGWEGLIYQGGYASEAQFQRTSLREYTSYLPTVGVDFTYYAWPMPEMMAYLVESTPENFRLCPKVTKRITLSQFPDLPAYGKWAGKKNPDYLDIDLFRDQFLAPLSRLQNRVGIIQFEFNGPFIEDLPALESFFERIPRDLPYAVEIRNPELVTEEFYSLLIRQQISPVFSLWSKMPPIHMQLEHYRKAGGEQDTTPLVGVGLIRPGRGYDEAVRMFQPYKELKDTYDEGCSDLAAIARFALRTSRKAFILVSNRLEGSAPHTVGRVVSRMQESSLS